MYNVLGLNFGHDGSAAIVKEGKLVCAISNERLSRDKKAAGVTREMLQYVLDAAGLAMGQIQYVAYSSYFYSPDNYVKILDSSGATYRSDLLDLRAPETIFATAVEIEGRRYPGAFVHHHMAHAASAYYTSPFDRSACFTMDASVRCAEACSLFAYGDGPLLHYLCCPGLMIGNAYSTFTEKLGIGSGLTKAGTTMALASFAQASPLAVQKWQHYGKSCFERGDQSSDEVFINLMWSELSGLPPHVSLPKEKSDSEQAMSIAADLEHIFEQTAVQAATDLYYRTQSYNGDNLCLSGGSFLNSITNMRIKRETPFKNVHLFPACGDDGTAAGAALYLIHHHLSVPRIEYSPPEYMYLGRSYDISEPGGRPYNVRQVAQAISEGKIVAYFQGGSEFGPRALGHRSIFADPRNPQMKDILNQRVKHREWFRPFAPIVLSECASQWFDVDFESKLMLFIAPIKKPKEIPAVAHVDGTARLQTLTRDDNPQVYDLIKEFERITGVPIILNTSLNDNGEPLVETPADAMRFFAANDVDILVLEDRVFEKTPQQ